jgi:hypothetical protein
MSSRLIGNDVLVDRVIVVHTNSSQEHARVGVCPSWRRVWGLSELHVFDRLVFRSGSVLVVVACLGIFRRRMERGMRRSGRRSRPSRKRGGEPMVLL